MSNPAEWIQVKIRRTTHAALREWTEETLAVVQRQNRTDIPYSPENGIGLDVAIATLLARDKAHRERGKKAKAKKPQEQQTS